MGTISERLGQASSRSCHAGGDSVVGVGRNHPRAPLGRASDSRGRGSANRPENGAGGAPWGLLRSLIRVTQKWLTKR
ncbi:MAG: hypothetical protein OEW48_15825 [Phycisphaerae bacterium]|nr:hypothetical protein [Phycisphaerae bacterium]